LVQCPKNFGFRFFMAMWDGSGPIYDIHMKVRTKVDTRKPFFDFLRNILLIRFSRRKCVRKTTWKCTLQRLAPCTVHRKCVISRLGGLIDNRLKIVHAKNWVPKWLRFSMKNHESWWGELVQFDGVNWTIYC
jgi:hypothetical protein